MSNAKTRAILTDLMKQQDSLGRQANEIHDAATQETTEIAERYKHLDRYDRYNAIRMDVDYCALIAHTKMQITALHNKLDDIQAAIDLIIKGTDPLVEILQTKGQTS